MAMTPLDQAFAELEDGAEAAYRRYYAAFAAAELFVPMTREGVPDAVEVDGAAFALAFDTEARLQDFAQGETERAVLTGRALVAAMVAQGAGIGLNLGVAETAMLLDAETVAWIAEQGQADVVEDAGGIAEIETPQVTAETLRAIDGFLARLTGEAAYLCGSRDGLVLILRGEDGAALAAGLAEVLALSGTTEPVRLAVTESAAALARAANVGIRFDLPEPQAQAAPGGDPTQPPRLR